MGQKNRCNTVRNSKGTYITVCNCKHGSIEHEHNK